MEQRFAQVTKRWGYDPGRARERVLRAGLCAWVDGESPDEGRVEAAEKIWDCFAHYAALGRRKDQPYVLDLSRLKLNSLPPEIGLLSHVSWLDLSDNCLSRLPDSLATWRKSGQDRDTAGLGFLMLHGNPLVTLPDWLGCMSDLQYLWASDCQLRELAEPIVNRLAYWCQCSFFKNPLLSTDVVNLGMEAINESSLMASVARWHRWDSGIFYDAVSVWDTSDAEDSRYPEFGVFLDRLGHVSSFLGEDWMRALAPRISRVLRAMAVDGAERKLCLEIARDGNSDCHDRALHTFHKMETAIEGSRLKHRGASPGELIRFGRGFFRFEQLQRRAVKLADSDPYKEELEVELAYLNDLADDLDLPVVSPGMIYRQNTGVSTSRWESWCARQAVLGAERTSKWPQYLSRFEAWSDFLEKAYEACFDWIKARHDLDAWVCCPAGMEEVEYDKGAKGAYQAREDAIQQLRLDLTKAYLRVLDASESAKSGLPAIRRWLSCAATRTGEAEVLGALEEICVTWIVRGPKEAAQRMRPDRPFGTRLLAELIKTTGQAKSPPTALAAHHAELVVGLKRAGAFETGWAQAALRRWPMAIASHLDAASRTTDALGSCATPKQERAVCLRLHEQICLDRLRLLET